MMRTRIYNSRLSSNSSQKVITSKISERECIIKKDFLHHWVLKNIPIKFVASNESLWNAHSVELASTSAYEVNYQTLAESNKGPEVIEHKNTIAMQFHIDKNYEATILLLQNFVDHRILSIQEKGKMHMMIEEGENLLKSLLYTKGPNKSSTSSLLKFRRDKKHQELKSDVNKTNSLRKEGIRPITAKSGSNITLSGRFQTTSASSRANKDRRIMSSRKSRLHSRQVRLFSPQDHQTKNPVHTQNILFSSPKESTRNKLKTH